VDINNHRVMRWDSGATTGVKVFGDRPTGGSLINDLYFPMNCKVDAAGLLLVVDTGNHRIMYRGVDSFLDTPLVIAGTTGVSGNDASHLFYPKDIWIDDSYTLDPYKYLYILDYGNDRIVRVPLTGPASSPVPAALVELHGGVGFTPAFLGTVKFPAGIARDFDDPANFPTLYTDSLEPARAMLLGGNRPLVPTVCDADNQGRCDCANLKTPSTDWDNLVTYSWWENNQQRCATLYTPSGMGGAAPVILYLKGSAMDSLSGLGITGDQSAMLLAAERLRVAMLFLSTPFYSGNWDFGNDGEVYDLPVGNPQPCAEGDSMEINYLESVLSFIAGESTLDGARVYTYGFDQDGAFAAYVAFCFPDKIHGTWMGAAGLALKGQSPTPARKQVECTASAYQAYGDACTSSAPCTTCQYWPIYPCWGNSNPRTVCLGSYTDDTAVFSSSTDNLVDYMYSALDLEGHDVRSLKFAPYGPTGGHFDPENVFDWVVGCLGVNPVCSPTCETGLIQCVDVASVYSWLAYATCIASLEPTPCAAGCAATKAMLDKSQTPTTTLSEGVFGETTAVYGAQATGSKCASAWVGRTLPSTSTAAYLGDITGTATGSTADRFFAPAGVFVRNSDPLRATHATNYYVADYANHRVQMWASDATSGVTVAGGNSFGSALNQLSYPYGVWVDVSGHVYVADTHNHRIVRWKNGAATGEQVVGGLGQTGDQALFFPFDVVVDVAGRMVVTDGENQRVRRWHLGPEMRVFQCMKSLACNIEFSGTGLHLASTNQILILALGESAMKKTVFQC
jgi:poly(3-hydroxybutyrate) depolymerase/sugar lactone lactonase YvrE